MSITIYDFVNMTDVHALFLLFLLQNQRQHRKQQRKNLLLQNLEKVQETKYEDRKIIRICIAESSI